MAWRRPRHPNVGAGTPPRDTQESENGPEDGRGQKCMTENDSNDRTMERAGYEWHTTARERNRRARAIDGNTRIMSSNITSIHTQAHCLGALQCDIVALQETRATEKQKAALEGTAASGKLGTYMGRWRRTAGIWGRGCAGAAGHPRYDGTRHDGAGAPVF